jgi:hypothetical protein
MAKEFRKNRESPPDPNPAMHVVHQWAREDSTDSEKISSFGLASCDRQTRRSS